MILPGYPEISLVLQAVLTVLSLTSLSHMIPGWHRSTKARSALYAIAAIILGLHLLWASTTGTVRDYSGMLTVVLFPAHVLFTLSLIVSSVVRGTLSALLGVREPSPSKTEAQTTTTEQPEIALPPTRRAVLSMATVALPATSIGVSLNGVVHGTEASLLRDIPMKFSALPPALEGFRILQLSDLHLGCTRNLSHLETFLASLRERPDMIVLTGDIAENPNLLPGCLQLVEAVRPRYGSYSVVGNHDLYRAGHDRIRRDYERSAVDLLLNETRIIRVGNASIELSGIDDPFVVHQPIHAILDRFFRQLDQHATHANNADKFRLLLTHRPEGFDFAHERNIDLSLAGHTHGGHIGFAGRSAFERIWPEMYLWGKYARGQSQLYTTSGFGHWMPFRPGCPTEAPMIRLVRG